MEKPSTLFLIALTGIGSAILSPITVNGMPVISLILPLALLAHYLYGVHEGIAVGLAGSVVSGALISNVENWDIVIYALTTTITIWTLETVYPKQKNPLHYLAAAALGTLLFEGLLDLNRGNWLLLRPEHFLGTYPSGGIRVVVNVLVTGLVLSFYETPAAGKK